MKKVLIALVILLAVAGGTLYWAYERLDIIVKFALEHYGPDVTGVPIRVAHVEISPKDGRGSLKGLEVGNAPGFSAPLAAKLGEVRLAIDPATIRSRLVHIREIAIEAPLIVYERGPKGTNLDAIHRNIEGYVARNAPPKPSDPGKGDPVWPHHKFVVDRLTIRAAKVTMTLPGLRGQGVTFDMADIELRDLGKREGGITASEIANIVTNMVIAKIAQKVLTNFDLLRKGGVEGAIDALKGLIR